MTDVRVIIQRDSEREERVVTTGTTAAELFAGERSVVAARVAGVLKDLAYQVRDGETVEAVGITGQDGLDILRHSTAHVMAQAVQEIFPEAKLGIGPPIKDGFYYDFDVPEPFTPEDLKRVEKKMQEIVKRGQRFSRRVTTDEDARAELADEPYKLELIGLKGSAADAAEGASAEVGAGELTIYDNLDAKSGELCWKDLCRGPHLPTTRNIPAFKLMRSAAAYWRGSEKNKQLQRIYGTAWPTRDELKAHLEFLAEAEKRDHRKLGTELDLFSFPDELGPGLAVFHPRGGVVRKVMEDYSRRRHEDADYEFVNTPHLSKEQLFETSGHLPSYAENMFPPVQFDEQNYRLKAMNCPMHNLIFKSRGRSYRELPLRLFEFGTVYRYEKSGVVHGLTRSRGFTQDDSHIYCTREQMADELDSLLTFVLDLLRDYGLTDFELELSTRDDSDKFIGEPEELGGGHRGAAAGGGEAGAAAGARPGRRRVLRTEDLRAGQGRHRAQLADVDDPGRLPAAQAVRPGVHRGGRFATDPGNAPPRAVRLHRAVFRGAAGALRGCVPGLAGPGAGCRHPDRRHPRPLPAGVRRRGEEAGPAGRGGLLLGPDAEEDPQCAEGQGALHGHRGRRRHGGRCGQLPLPRRQPEERRPP